MLYTLYFFTDNGQLAKTNSSHSKFISEYLVSELAVTCFLIIDIRIWSYGIIKSFDVFFTLEIYEKYINRFIRNFLQNYDLVCTVQILGFCQINHWREVTHSYKDDYNLLWAMENNVGEAILNIIQLSSIAWVNIKYLLTRKLRY